MNKTAGLLFFAAVATIMIASPIASEAMSSIGNSFLNLQEDVKNANKNIDKADKSLDMAIKHLGFVDDWAQNSASFVGDDLGDPFSADFDRISKSSQELLNDLDCSPKDLKCLDIQSKLDAVSQQADSLRKTAENIAVELDTELIPRAEKINSDIKIMNATTEELKITIKDIKKELLALVDKSAEK